MVVVSGTWAKNVATYPTPSELVIADNAKMTARAVLICRPNSHSFQERSVTLEQPVKVGRSVARARATPYNAIFDCKVLSRNHAVIWYENGKFYLQDTKSSNGTFVNNNRLTPETEHHEVNSGDIVQFGVDVLENNRKVTHGCIIATLKLFLPDGKEAKASPIIAEHASHVVPLDELYKLQQIIQEATQREQCLETKLLALQNCVDEARKSAEESWQAYVGEERLLSRISALETQLHQTINKNWGEEKFRDEIAKLQNESAAYQIAAKEALEKLHAERLAALNVATEQERGRISSQQEGILIKEQLIQAQQEVEDLARNLDELGNISRAEKREMEKKIGEMQANLEGAYKMNCINAAQHFGDYQDDCETDLKMNKANGVDSDDNNKSNNGNIYDDENKEDMNEKTEKESEDEDSPSDLLISRQTIMEEDENEDNEIIKKVSFNIESVNEARNGTDLSPVKEVMDEFDDSDHIDSKTLKYKYQSAQNELKKRIELLESFLESNKMKMVDLERCVGQERELSRKKDEETIELRALLEEMRRDFKGSCEANEALKERIGVLVREKDELCVRNEESSGGGVSYSEFVGLEEEMVVLKERYAQINEEKLKLHHDLALLKEQYNRVCNSSHDKMYFYMAPLILIILYLVISAMIS